MVPMFFVVPESVGADLITSGFSSLLLLGMLKIHNNILIKRSIFTNL